MKNETLEKINYVDQLLTVLDLDIRHLEENLLRLNELRGLVIKRDHHSLGRLLETIQAELKPYSDNELKRKMLCKKLAALLGWDTEQLTLSRVGMELGGAIGSELLARKNKLQTLTHRLKNEYTCTQVLLADCSRFNRMLIKSIFQVRQLSPATYSPTGAAERQTNTVFMNFQF